MIELIIAIAILIILTGLIAPQFLKYIERSRAAVCANNIDAILEEYQADRVDNEALKLQVYVDKYQGKCPSGGKYLDFSEVTGRPAIMCKIHSILSGSGSDPSASATAKVYADMLDFVGENTQDIKKLLEASGVSGMPSNDTLRNYLQKKYGGSWPEFDEEILDKNHIKIDADNPMYIQPYMNLKKESINDTKLEDTTVNNVFVYAGNTPGQRWVATLIYNPADSRWYRSPTGKTYPINDKSWDEVKANTIDNGWIPLQ